MGVVEGEVAQLGLLGLEENLDFSQLGFSG